MAQGEPDDRWSDAERSLLERRAQSLHRASTAELQPSWLRASAVVASAGASTVAFPSRYVLSVGPLMSLTVAHSGPPKLRGLFAFRDEVLPVFLLSDLLGANVLPNERSHVVVLGDRRPELAIAVDRLRSVEPLPASLTRLSSSLVVPTLGALCDGVPVLDVEALLRHPALRVDSTLKNS